MEIPKGFIPHDFKYVSDQPYVSMTGFSMINPLIAKMLVEINMRENKPFNTIAKKPVGLLDMPTHGMFYHSPLNGIKK